MKGRSGGVLDNKYPIEIYANSPEAIPDDSFIYIDIFNLCDGARAYVSKMRIEVLDLF